MATLIEIVEDCPCNLRLVKGFTHKIWRWQRLRVQTRSGGNSNRVQSLKGEFTFIFIRELDVPPLGESNLMGPKKSVEVKFFTVAFFGVCRASSNGAGRHFSLFKTSLVYARNHC